MEPINGRIVRAAGAVLRQLGQAVDRFGLSMQGKEGYVERLVPSTRVVKFKGKDLRYGYQNYVASTASVIGDVSVGEMTSAWYGAVLRGDKGPISVGRNCAVLDNAVVAGSRGRETKLGSDVVVSPGANVSGAEIGDGTMVGMGAVVMPGAKIGNDCFIDAGAVVVAGTVVPSGTLWTGSPARQLRALKPEEMSYLRTMANVYGGLSQRYFEQEAKSPEALEGEEETMLLRRELRLKPDAEIPQVSDDVVQYYKLTHTSVDAGLLRGHEFNKAAESALREAEEVAADAAENAMYAQAARMRRVGATLKAIAATRADRPAQRAKAVAELASRDPEGAALLADFVARVSEAGSPGKEDARAHLLGVIASIDPQAPFYADEKEARDQAEKTFAAAAAHASELLRLEGGAAGAAAAAAAGGTSAAAAPKPLA